MVGKGYYKKYIERLIADNPTTIEIKRLVKEDDGYGGVEVTEKIIRETVTFYDRSARREVVTELGKSYVGVQVTKILTKSDADIIKGDTFVVDGVKYKVFFPKNYRDICKQIELEVIE